MSSDIITGDVCRPSHSILLDNFFRRMFQKPRKIVGEYIQNGDTVIDLGCGPGFFSIDMAEMAGSRGKLYAVDLQNEMLDKVKKKAEDKGLTHRICFHKCPQDSIGLGEHVKADFILAYYMMHEVPDSRQFLNEIRGLLKKDGRLLIVEPTFHVTKKKFIKMLKEVEDIGFSIVDTPLKKGGRSLLLSAA
jgi:ubiquinone/menaquinone biosynthesis C-methylase UbiE